MKIMEFWSVALTLLTAAAFTGCITAEDTSGSPSVGEHDSELGKGIAKQHCVMSIMAQPTDGTTGTVGSVAPVQCFETFPEAIFAATNGRVQLPPSAIRTPTGRSPWPRQKKSWSNRNELRRLLEC